MVPAYGMVFLPPKRSTENTRTPGCSFILSVGRTILETGFHTMLADCQAAPRRAQDQSLGPCLCPCLPCISPVSPPERGYSMPQSHCLISMPHALTRCRSWQLPLCESHAHARARRHAWTRSAACGCSRSILTRSSARWARTKPSTCRGRNVERKSATFTPA